MKIRSQRVERALPLPTPLTIPQTEKVQQITMFLSPLCAPALLGIQILMAAVQSASPYTSFGMESIPSFPSLVYHPPTDPTMTCFLVLLSSFTFIIWSYVIYAAIFDHFNHHASKPTLSQPTNTKKPSPNLSPMQTYDMSDREESDSESDSDDEYERQRPKKTIPEWAQKANLHRALERQFADGPNRLDPDQIFGEVLTCNLEEIFDKKKSRYQRRTSSGNWKQDHVSLSEKMAYKRTMGYSK